MADSYKDLVIWQKGMELVKDVYKLISIFPKEEVYGLSSQIKRSVISIPSNIAEGRGRNSSKEFTRFLQISIGSLFELETQLEIAKNLGFIEPREYESIYVKCLELEKMISSLINKLGRVK
ncbi:four helix bundle protein [Dissulfuribacter thermophilus]|uniref:four helix bundle protein n=1 Tax=Dissulfuribacter thermophilus TaxID=1156395 RepID=UPI00082D06A6|nr:four helix bundle protein [Dissulfuribacter thermophilus]